MVWSATDTGTNARTGTAIAVSSEIGQTEWDAFVHRHGDATVDHLWGWRPVFDDVFGHRTQYLAARRGEAVVGVLPLVLFRSGLIGRAVVSLPFLNYGGVLADNADAVRALTDRAVAIAREWGASHLELRHRRRLVDSAPSREHKLALVRPLPATVEALWSGTDRKVRNQVRKAQKEGLSTAMGGAELVDEFYGVFARNMRDLGTPVYSKRLFTETLRVFADRTRIFVVRSGGRAVAAAIALAFRATVLVPWASSLRQFRHQCPNMLLYWSMLEQAARDGMTAFDFGRSSPGGGTHQFKLQWGAEPSPLVWEYPFLEGREVPDHSPANPKFQTAIAVWKHCPLWLANAVGPHIVRAIP
jgi:FemAB-related protein (PEP-CTERM system-associated)